MGFGVHHSGVEILGQEYSFASGGGIFDSTPKEVPNAKFRESIEVGVFQGGSSELRTIINDLRSDFGPDDYNLMSKNCNHFANSLVWSLLGRTIPPHINRIADIGTCLSCLVPKQLLEGSPVGPNSNNSGGDNSANAGFQVFGGRDKDNNTSSNSNRAFMGSGSKLSSSNNNNNDSNASSGFGSLFQGKGSTQREKGNEDLIDRREKARKAALARLNQSGVEGK